ncbi:MAG: hypothetical protein R3C26_10870 [Calditrichia bacterium]
MIAAQIALNYGLFCKQIVFHGAFTEVDRQFLLAMADNTATEIYVNKLLQPNPFLIGDAAKLPVLRKKSYLQSTLVFPDPLPEKLPQWQGDTQKNRHFIQRRERQPAQLRRAERNRLRSPSDFRERIRAALVYGAQLYRYFRDHVPHTARVWMNSDRLFSWMFRRLPFIRTGFCDHPGGYLSHPAVDGCGIPVQHFAAGAQTGIARVVIGDEYDSTRGGCA